MPREAQTVKRLPAMQETQVRFLGREDPPKMRLSIHSLPGEFHGQRLQSMGPEKVRHD